MYYTYRSWLRDHMTASRLPCGTCELRKVQPSFSCAPSSSKVTGVRPISTQSSTITMSAQIYPVQTYKPSGATGRRLPLTNTANQQQQPPVTTAQKAQVKPKQPGSPPLPRQNTKATPPSPPDIIRDKNGQAHLRFTRVGFLGEV